MTQLTQDEALAELLARHLALLQEPISYNLPFGLAETRIRMLCDNLLAVLLFSQGNAALKLPLYEELRDLQQQQHLSAPDLQRRAVQLVQDARY
jgi:hypothetical protein